MRRLFGTNIFVKILVTLLIYFSSSEIAGSQTLAGKWKGYYYDETDRRDFNKKQFLSLEFILNADSSYSAFSYTNLSNARAECRLYFEFIGRDSLYLEEVEVIKPAKQAAYCQQRMKLRISRSTGNEFILSGRWDSAEESCGKGMIFFQKQR